MMGWFLLAAGTIYLIVWINATAVAPACAACACQSRPALGIHAATRRPRIEYICTYGTAR